MTGIMGSLLRTSEWIFRLMRINFLWILFNIPIVYLFIDLFFRQTVDEAMTILIVMIILIPFILFPATTAMFGLMRRWITGKGTSRLFLNYWKLYKENYIKSFFSSFIFIIIWGIWIVNYRITDMSVGSLIFYVYLFVLLFLVALTSHFFSDLVHFEINIFRSLQKVVFMTVFYLPYTLGSAAATIIVLGFIYLIHPILILIFSASIISYIYFYAYHQIYLRAKDRQANLNSNDSTTT